LAPVNIGDFDSAWENYDHWDGPSLIDEAKETYKAGDTRPNWRLVIGGQDMTRRLLECEVTFNVSGESGMTGKVATQLHKQGYERARTSLWIGYGNKLVPFFRGKLERPMDSPSGLYSEFTAFGIATQLGARHFGHRISYAGFTIREFFDDIVAKFGADEDRFFFDGEHDQVIQGETDDVSEAEFGLEHTYLEAIQAILPQMQFVPYDQIGGMYVVRKLPRIDATTRVNLTGILDDSDDKERSFQFTDSYKNMYSKVIIFRRNEDFPAGGAAEEGGEGMTQDENGEWVPETFSGSEADAPDAKTWREGRSKASEYAVYVEREVDNSGPFNVHGGRAYVIPDYPGQQEHAENEADWLKAAFEAGVGRFELETWPIEFAWNDFFGFERREERRTPEGHASFGQLYWTSRGDIYDVLYACQVEEMTVTIAGGEQPSFNMRVSGPAAIREENLVQAATDVTPIELSIPPDDDTPPAGLPQPGELVGLKASSDDVKAGTDTVVVEVN
jgi:hypothetical protein